MKDAARKPSAPRRKRPTSRRGNVRVEQERSRAGEAGTDKIATEVRRRSAKPTQKRQEEQSVGKPTPRKATRRRIDQGRGAVVWHPIARRRAAAEPNPRAMAGPTRRRPNRHQPKIAPATPAEKPRRSPSAEQLAAADRAVSAAEAFAERSRSLKPLAEPGMRRRKGAWATCTPRGRRPRDTPRRHSWYREGRAQGLHGGANEARRHLLQRSGTARNNNLAYVWYGNAARLGATAAKAESDRIGALLQPAERTQADKVIEEDGAEGESTRMPSRAAMRDADRAVAASAGTAGWAAGGARSPARRVREPGNQARRDQRYQRRLQGRLRGRSRTRRYAHVQATSRSDVRCGECRVGSTRSGDREAFTRSRIHRGRGAGAVTPRPQRMGPRGRGRPAEGARDHRTPHRAPCRAVQFRARGTRHGNHRHGDRPRAEDPKCLSPCGCAKLRRRSRTSPGANIRRRRPQKWGSTRSGRRSTSSSPRARPNVDASRGFRPARPDFRAP